MREVTRRSAIGKMTKVSLLAAIGTTTGLYGRHQEQSPKNERDIVLATGMTAEEADCWELVADLARKMFDLPELHPMDREEITAAIHVLQIRLLSRPTYRRYKELHKQLPDIPDER